MASYDKHLEYGPSRRAQARALLSQKVYAADDPMTLKQQVDSGIPTGVLTHADGCGYRLMGGRPFRFVYPYSDIQARALDGWKAVAGAIVREGIGIADAQLLLDALLGPVARLTVSNGIAMLQVEGTVLPLRLSCPVKP